MDLEIWHKLVTDLISPIFLLAVLGALIRGITWINDIKSTALATSATLDRFAETMSKVIEEHEARLNQVESEIKVVLDRFSRPTQRR